MSWSLSDEAVFVSFLRLRIGYENLSDSKIMATLLRKLAILLSEARYREFRPISLVMKLYELKNLYHYFEDFKCLPGIKYDEDSNRVTATDSYFRQYGELISESAMHKDFRMNGMPEYRAIRDIVKLGGIVVLDFESLMSSLA